VIRKHDIFIRKEEMIFRFLDLRSHNLDRYYHYILFLLNLYKLKQRFMYMCVSVCIHVFYMHIRCIYIDICI